MTPKTFPEVDLWIDDSELEELALQLERIVHSTPRPHTNARSVFFADYYDAE